MSNELNNLNNILNIHDNHSLLCCSLNLYLLLKFCSYCLFPDLQWELNLGRDPFLSVQRTPISQGKVKQLDIINIPSTCTFSPSVLLGK